MAVVRVDGEERVAKLAGRLRGRFGPVAGDEVDVTVMDDGTNWTIAAWAVKVATANARLAKTLFMVLAYLSCL